MGKEKRGSKQWPPYSLLKVATLARVKVATLARAKVTQLHLKRDRR